MWNWLNRFVTRQWRMVMGLFLVLSGGILAESGSSGILIGVFFGSGFTLSLEALRSASDERDAWKRDLDETRRTLYIALASTHEGSTERAEIAGTAMNALAHHSKHLSLEEAEELGYRIVSGGVFDGDLHDALREEIALITKRLAER